MAQPHEVLGVAANADKATINAAFRSAAKRFHPDLNNGDPAATRRFRRLTAARDFLTGRKWGLPRGPKAKYLLPPLRKAGVARGLVLIIALAGACAFMLLPGFVPEPEASPTKVSIVQKTSHTWVSHVGAPDAGSAEIKAIRDLQEDYWRPDAEAEDDALLQNGAKRQASSPAAGLKKAVQGAAALVSKTFHKIASVL